MGFMTKRKRLQVYEKLKANEEIAKKCKDISVTDLAKLIINNCEIAYLVGGLNGIEAMKREDNESV